MAQFARPDADESIGLWRTNGGSASALWGTINEVSPNNADYAESDTQPSFDAYEVHLSDPTDPGTDTGHIGRVRFQKSGSAGNVLELTVELRQGSGLLIVSRTYSDISNTLTAASFTLTEAEAGGITNYPDLRYKFIANTTNTGGLGRRARVIWAELELPDAPPPLPFPPLFGSRPNTLLRR